MATTELQPLISELFLGSWVNVTSLVERDNGQGIRISRKPLTWAERVAPTSASWTFKNTSNNLYGRNPNSIYYGLLGRNTPVRHRLLTFGDDFEGRTSSNGWGNNWTIRSGTSNSDFSVASGTAKQTHTAVDSLHIITHDTGNVDHDLIMDVSLPVTNAAGTGNITQWAIIRYVDTNNYLAAILALTTAGVMTLQLAKRVGGTLTTYGAPSVTVGTGHVSNEVWRVRVRPKGNWFSCMAWRPASDAEPTSWQASHEIEDAVFATSTTIGFGSRLEVGNTNTLNVVVSFQTSEANSYRFWGEIPSFSPTRDSTSRQKAVPVSAAGLGQRLQAGTRTLTSALTSTMDGISAVGDITPVAHWNMEDAAGSTQFGNLRAGGPALIAGPVSPAAFSYSGPTGSAAVPIINNGGQISGTFPPNAIATDGSGRQIWQLQFQGVIPSGMSANAVFLEIFVQDTGGDHIVKWRIEWDNGLGILTARPYDRTGAQLTGAAIIPNANEYDRPLLFGLNVYNPTPGGVVSQQFGIYKPNGLTNVTANTAGTGATLFVPIPQSWRASATSVNAGWSISHMALYADAELFTAANQTDNAQAIDGLQGELSGTRMIRLSRQVGVPFELIGDETDTQPCGSQPQGTYFSVMQATADVDQGVLREARDLLALEYVTLTYLYNRDARITYNHGAGTDPHDLEAFQVIDDDRTVRNKVTARRTNGSFAIAEITEGGTSTAEPPDGIGAYPEDLTWNLATDDQLVSFAGWRAHKLGWDEARYPATAIWRQRAAIADVPALDAATLAMDITDRYTISDPPTDLPPDDIELTTQGYEELLANFEHQITLDGTAAKPYDIMEADGTGVRVTGNHVLRSGVDSSATSWDINSLDPGIQLIADDAQDGWYWMIDGELVQVTDVAAPTTTFVGVGTAATAVNAATTPGLPASIATGDLMLVFASCRPTTGIPQLPLNWDQVYLDGNIAVYAKLYAGGGAGEMPTITYSGTAAGDDTIAQSCAFRGKFTSTDRIFIRNVGCLSPAAIDIITGGVPIWELPEYLVAINLAWKQDNFTASAAAGSWTKIQETSSSAGNDAGQCWSYRFFTSRPPAGSLQPTTTDAGGTSVVNRGAVLILSPDYQTVTVVRGVNGVFKAHSANAVPVLVPAPHIGM